jgi:hypothetical protein
MDQLNLPLYNPRDRGRLNALRNIVAAVSEELRRQAPVAQGIIDFTVNQFPQILRQHTPLDILSPDFPTPVPVSPYPFEIFDLIQIADRPEVFATVADLVAHLDTADLAAPVQGVELLGIDESQVDAPIPQSTLTFRASV